MNLKIGDTPLIELTQALGLQNGARVFAKLETENAGGSIKDRVALAIIEDAERKGALKKGGYIVEATSGNTGIGLALVCKEKDCKAEGPADRESAHADGICNRFFERAPTIDRTDRTVNQQCRYSCPRPFIHNNHPSGIV